MNARRFVFSRKLSGLAVAMTSALLGATTLGSAATWDVTTQYSVSSNPNGAWSYGWESTLNGSLDLYDAVRAADQWYASSHHSGDWTPTVWQNDLGYADWGVLPGQISLHPGWDNSFSVVRWTSPISGTIDVSGFFGAGDLGAMSYYIAANDVTALSWLTDSGTENFAFSQSVSAGDTLDFIVGTPIGGGYGFGNTPLGVTIETSGTAPEPSTWVLMLAGLAGIGLVRYRTPQRRAATAAG